jgi:hypothetical protein
MSRLYIVPLLLIFVSGSLFGQQKERYFKKENFHHQVFSGVNVGALTPTSLPNTIRKIERFNPKFNPSIGYGLTYNFAPKWSVGAGVQLDKKGMQVRDSVQYFHTLITTDNGTEKSEFEGAFSGTNQTSVSNLYITMPLYIVLQPGKKWRYNLGVYLATLVSGKFNGNVSDGYIRNGGSLGEKIQIEKATFDFSDIQRKFDWGLQGGVERKFKHNFSVHANIQWGLQPVFPDSFKGVGAKMYNIFARIGVGYELFKKW